HPRPPASPLSPYTTLFRSRRASAMSGGAASCAPATPSTMVVSSAPLEPALSLPYVMKKFTPIAIAAPPCAVVPSPKLGGDPARRSEEHTSELQSRFDLVCR